LKSWLGNKAEFLEPAAWFERGHDILGESKDAKGFWRPCILPRTFMWTPPPAAVALKKLRKARIKHQKSLHMVVIPRLFKPEWFKQLYKACDLVFAFLISLSCWCTNMHEPVMVGIVFLGKRHKPEDEYHSGRNGDHCMVPSMVPSECDICIFQKL
jgi:hypothetical protein